MKQYEYGRTQPCERGSGQQELAVETYRVKTKIINNHVIHKTQSLLQIIILNLTKSKMLAVSTKYTRQQKYQRRQNIIPQQQYPH
jgi:hypothetical protein